MTREEAARVIESHAKHGFGTGLFGLPEAFTAAVTALRGPQPDPITGLVPCGCGERVSISFYPGWAGTPDLYQVDCFNCHVGTRPCQTAEQAKAAWNTAMGWRVEE